MTVQIVGRSLRACDMVATREHCARTQLAEITRIRAAIAARPDLDIRYDVKSDSLYCHSVINEATHAEIIALPVPKGPFTGRPRVVARPFIIVAGWRIDGTDNPESAILVGGHYRGRVNYIYPDMEPYLLKQGLPEGLGSLIIADLGRAIRDGQSPAELSGSHYRQVITAATLSRPPGGRVI